MVIKNNVTRMLDVKNISYRTLEIPSRKMSAVEVADFLHLPPEKVFKSIVFEREKTGKPIIALVPATGTASPKKIAKYLNEKKISVATLHNAEKLTGLRAGGISPLALGNKGFQVVLDSSALNKGEICISGGQWGLQIQLGVQDLIRLTNAKTTAITT